MSAFPFMAVTLSAIVVFILSGVASVVTASAGGHDKWHKTSDSVRGLYVLFHVRRDEVRLRVTWLLILIQRVSLPVAIVSLILDLASNP